MYSAIQISVILLTRRELTQPAPTISSAAVSTGPNVPSRAYEHRSSTFPHGPATIIAAAALMRIGLGVLMRVDQARVQFITVAIAFRDRFQLRQITRA